MESTGQPGSALVSPGEHWSAPGILTYEIDEMAVRNVNTWNDVNRASASTVKQSPASGRCRGHKAAQVVNK